MGMVLRKVDDVAVQAFQYLIPKERHCDDQVLTIFTHERNNTLNWSDALEISAACLAQTSTSSLGDIP